MRTRISTTHTNLNAAATRPETAEPGPNQPNLPEFLRPDDGDKPPGSLATSKMVQESDWEMVDQGEGSWAYSDREDHAGHDDREDPSDEDHEGGGISNDELGADDEDLTMNGDDRGGGCSLC